MRQRRVNHGSSGDGDADSDDEAAVAKTQAIYQLSYLLTAVLLVVAIYLALFHEQAEPHK